MGCTYFDFLSAIDWLPSPFGRDMDSQEDLVVSGAEPKEPLPMVTGYAGGDTRLQVFARVSNLDRHHGVTLKVDIPDDDPSLTTWVPVYAGANWHERETWEMYGITFVGHPAPGAHVPARRLRGQPDAQGLPAAGPPGEAVARHRRRRAHARRCRRRGDEASEGEGE